MEAGGSRSVVVGPGWEGKGWRGRGGGWQVKVAGPGWRGREATSMHAPL